MLTDGRTDETYDVDVPLLRAVLTFVTANRQVHDQTTWLAYGGSLLDDDGYVPASWGADVRAEPVDDPLAEADRSMAAFACNTVGCLAGWVALATGFTPHVRGNLPDTDEVVAGRSSRWLTRLRAVVPEWEGPDGPWTAATVARCVLGLRPRHAQLLFAADNTLRDLWEYAAALTDGAIEVPTELRDAPASVADHRATLACYHDDR